VLLIHNINVVLNLSFMNEVILFGNSYNNYLKVYDLQYSLL
jgi:hypothetical protein